MNEPECTYGVPTVKGVIKTRAGKKYAPVHYCVRVCVSLMEGGKEAPAVLSRWVTRALRRLTETKMQKARAKSKHSEAAAAMRGQPLRDAVVVVAVAADGSELVARVQRARGSS